jgi:hypothetical protein
MRSVMVSSPFGKTLARRSTVIVAFGLFFVIFGVFFLPFVLATPLYSTCGAGYSCSSLVYLNCSPGEMCNYVEWVLSNMSFTTPVFLIAFGVIIVGVGLYYRSRRRASS